MSRFNYIVAGLFLLIVSACHVRKCGVSSVCEDVEQRGKLFLQVNATCWDCDRGKWATIDRYSFYELCGCDFYVTIDIAPYPSPTVESKLRRNRVFNLSQGQIDEVYEILQMARGCEVASVAVVDICVDSWEHGKIDVLRAKLFEWAGIKIKIPSDWKDLKRHSFAGSHGVLSN